MKVIIPWQSKECLMKRLMVLSAKKKNFVDKIPAKIKNLMRTNMSQTSTQASSDFDEKFLGIKRENWKIGASHKRRSREDISGDGIEKTDLYLLALCEATL